MGGVLPLMVGIVVFPLIVKLYGAERFGILAIAWSLVGYFSLFDMGLSRALTQMVAERVSVKSDQAETVQLITTAFHVMWLLGLIGGLFLWLITPWLVHDVLSVTANIQQEIITSFEILSLAIPFVVHTSVLRGVMEALHLFKQASLIRLVLGLGTFIGPYLASLYSHSLVYASIALVVLRFLGWVMHFYVMKNTSLLRNNSKKFDGKWLKPLFSYGGWISISNIIGPLMVYLDRFVIAAMLGTASVAYYVAPYEIVTKLWLVPAAFAGVLFPVFARDWIVNPASAAKMLNQGIVYVLALVYPIALMGALYSHELLIFWLGSEFAVNGKNVVCWLSAGVVVNSVAHILYAKVQGVGRADLTAKLHLAESLPYWLFLWFAIKYYGLEGAAIAWFLRVSIDALGLTLAVRKINDESRSAIKIPMILLCLAVIPILAYIYIGGLVARSVLALVTALIYLTMLWTKLHHDSVLLHLKSLVLKK